MSQFRILLGAVTGGAVCRCIELAWSGSVWLALISWHNVLEFTQTSKYPYGCLINKRPFFKIQDLTSAVHPRTPDFNVEDEAAVRVLVWSFFSQTFALPLLRTIMQH